MADISVTKGTSAPLLFVFPDNQPPNSHLIHRDPRKELCIHGIPDNPNACPGGEQKQLCAIVLLLNENISHCRVIAAWLHAGEVLLLPYQVGGRRLGLANGPSAARDFYSCFILFFLLCDIIRASPLIGYSAHRCCPVNKHACPYMKCLRLHINVKLFIF